MTDKKLYTKDSIESLTPLEFTRLRPQVYCGDTSYSTQLLVEIISNSIDEYRLGHGNKIEVKVEEDDTITIRDYGQGFLVNEKRPEDGKTILEAAFSVLNTSGKYSEDGVYSGTSLGSFGIGSKITTYLSHKLIVTTYRDKKFETVTFKEGEFADRKVGKSAELTGTQVTYSPSEEFFTDKGIEIKKIKDLFKTISCLCPGLTIELTYKSEPKETFYSNKGLDDFVTNAVGEKEIIENRFHCTFNADEKNKMDFILTYTTDYSSNMIAYVNTGLTERGPHITLIKTFITREFNKFFREKGWLKEKDDNLEGSDIQEGMYIVFNITAPNVAYNAQVKSDITKIDMKPFTPNLTEELHMWLLTNEKEIKIIADKAINARKAREAAKKARDAARGVEKKKEKKLLNLPSKLIDAYGKKREKCELLIVEGDSAAGGLVEARNPELMAIFPIRGKIISAYKNSNEKIFANQEVVNIIKALGLDIDAKTGKMIYDKSKLRYGKIVLCADADPDGQAIKNLLLELFWWLCPELVKNGHIYAAIPPLFRITTKKNKYIFLKDQKALEEYKNTHTGESYLVNRNKGLGEQDASELREAIIDEKTRNIVQIVVEDEKEASKLMECLMGSSVPPRREYLLKHSEEANLE